MRKIFFISLGLFALALIFLGAYNFAFRKNINDPSVGTERTAGEDEGIEGGQSVPLSTSVANPVNEKVLGSAVGPDGNLYYYSADEGALKRASFEGKDKAVLLSDLPGPASRVLWAPKRDRALLQLQLPEGGRWHLADIRTKSLVELKPGIVNASWNHLGDKIFYIYKSGDGAQSLNIADPDGANWKEIGRLGSGTFFLAPIPQSNAVSLWNRPNASERTRFETINSDGGRRNLFTAQFGSDYLWDPTGKRVAISSSSGENGSGLNVSVMNADGSELRSLALPTLASKLAWSRDGGTLYYALPTALPEGSVLPNDYFAKSLSSQDTFWKLDISTNQKTRLLSPEAIGTGFDSIDLTLSAKEDALFFTDRISGKLYRIDL